MRFGWLAAVAAMMTAVPVGAATIVQRQYDEDPFGFNGFDTRLGTLNSVTLNVAANRNYDWQVRGPDTVNSFDVTYSINADYSVMIGGDRVIVPLTGSGALTISTNSRSAGYSFATVPLQSSTNTDLALSASLFNDRSLFFISGTDTAFQGGPGVTVTSPQADRILQYQNSCFGQRGSEDSCGRTVFTLTYDYTRLGVVPEPATWVMMILGFGVAGAGMRSTRRLSTLGLAA